ncbi:MAG TPA: RMD1 family protein [Flavitalea sp.]|nr:RMD1 family protein [Flavitalea sp.]
MQSEIIANQVADGIDLRQAKAQIRAPLYFAGPDELFYRYSNDKLLYIFKYGVICFMNFSLQEQQELINSITPFFRKALENPLNEGFIVETNAETPVLGFNKISIPNNDTNTLRIIMLNVSESVALDYYSELTNRLLEETNQHTLILQRKGKLDITGKNLRKYIGKTLFLKNQISENLYIFDSPTETWESEDLTKVDTGMKRTFDLQERFRNIQDELGIIRENLELFKDIMHHRHSNLLEWIIIILILVEVLNLLIEKIAQ